MGTRVRHALTYRPPPPRHMGTWELAQEAISHLLEMVPPLLDKKPQETAEWEMLLEVPKGDAVAELTRESLVSEFKTEGVRFESRNPEGTVAYWYVNMDDLRKASAKARAENDEGYLDMMRSR